ncbi:MAG: hypothetical protein IKZ52_03685 [Bacteroidales bacterium]|nr:hypothetical protein [Bacteroidales bacterium]
MSTIGEVIPWPPMDVQQTFDDTCAIKSQQLILKTFGIDIPEDDLRQEAIDKGIYTPGGGTSPEDVGVLLNEHGVDTHTVQDAHIFDLVNELAQGHKVIVGVDSGELWHDNWFDMYFEDQTADHALVVSAIDTTDPNNTQVILTDPGTGQPAATYSLAEFLDAWQDSNCFMVATNDAPPAGVDPTMVNFDYDAGHIPSILDVPFEIFQDIISSVSDFFGDVFSNNTQIDMDNWSEANEHVNSVFHEYNDAYQFDIDNTPDLNFHDMLFDGFDFM